MGGPGQCHITWASGRRFSPPPIFGWHVGNKNLDKGIPGEQIFLLEPFIFLRNARGAILEINSGRLSQDQEILLKPRDEVANKGAYGRYGHAG